MRVAPRSASGFLCPLRGPCFASAGPPFPSYQSCNEAVVAFCRASATERDARARALYQRCLPLVRKTLHRFCHPFRPGSRCYPGACLPEDLVGETYPIFRRALDAYDPSLGVDFVGYASRRLYWGLEHRARPLERAHAQTAIPEAPESVEPRRMEMEEDRLLQGLLVEDLLSRLDSEDAELMTRYAAGHSCTELAEWAGVSAAAVRKRLQRLRGRLRRLAQAE